jgi:hypothetical protein
MDNTIQKFIGAHCAMCGIISQLKEENIGKGFQSLHSNNSPSIEMRKMKPKYYSLLILQSELHRELQRKLKRELEQRVNGRVHSTRLLYLICIPLLTFISNSNLNGFFVFKQHTKVKLMKKIAHLEQERERLLMKLNDKSHLNSLEDCSHHIPTTSTHEVKKTKHYH